MSILRANRFIMFGTGYEEGDRWLTSAARLMGLMWESANRRQQSAMTAKSRACMWDDPWLESMIAEALRIPFISRTPLIGAKTGCHDGISGLVSFVLDNPTAVKRMLPAMESALHTVETMEAGPSRLGLLRECCPGVGDDPLWIIAYNMHYPVWLSDRDTVFVDKRRAFLEFACRHLIAAPVRCGGGWERVVTAAVTGYVSLPCFPRMPDDWDAARPDILGRMMGLGPDAGDGIGPGMAWAVPESVVLEMDKGPCDLPSMMLAYGMTDMGEAIGLSHDLAALAKRSKRQKSTGCAPPCAMGPKQMRLLMDMDDGRAATLMECLGFTPTAGFRRDLVPETRQGEDGVDYMVGFASRHSDLETYKDSMGRMFSEAMEGRKTVTADGIRIITKALAESAWTGDDVGCAAAMAAAKLMRIISEDDDAPCMLTARAVEESLRFIAEGYPSGFVAETLKSGVV